MIYYLGYYNCEQIGAENRVASPPAMNKMGYIISVLSEIPNIKALVVSPSETNLNRYIKGSTQKISDCISVKTFDSFSSKNRIIRVLGHIITKYHLRRFLMSHINSGDTLIVYHSLALMKVVKKIKKAKKCNLIIEVEELYSDVKENEVLRKKELSYLQIADKFIIITELLNKEVNLSNKPYIISHGTYQTVEKYCNKFDDGKIHLVYAGSFNPVKGGALAAIAVAEHLNENYVLHILGKGSTYDTDNIKRRIDEIAGKTKCIVAFEGYKSGKEFDGFIQSCHIGLSTQQPDGKYNASSFPSKILMYMSNGLPVVSINIPAVTTSNVRDYIYYYDESTPRSIADAIRSVCIDCDINIYNKLNELNEQFITGLSYLLN